MYLFSHDAKLYHHISDIIAYTLLQAGLNAVNDSANRWLLKININTGQSALTPTSHIHVDCGGPSMNC